MHFYSIEIYGTVRDSRTLVKYNVSDETIAMSPSAPKYTSTPATPERSKLVTMTADRSPVMDRLDQATLLSFRRRMLQLADPEEQ